MSCVFCSVVEKNDPHHEIVWQDAEHIAFLNRFPTNHGHTLVIPRAHIEYAFDLAPDAYARLMEASRKLAAPLRSYAASERIALAIDGFHVPHVHVHLVPVSKTGDLCLPAQAPSDETLAEVGDALRARFKDIV